MAFKRNGSRGIIALIVLVVIAVLVAGALWWLLTRLWPATHETPDYTNRNAAQQELAAIVADPSAYYDKNVTVQGEIHAAYTTQVFTLGTGVDNPLLVVTLQPLSNNQQQNASLRLVDNANVRAEGTVRRLTLEQIEQQYSIQISQTAKSEFYGEQTVLVANSLQYFDGDTLQDHTE